MFFLFGLQSSRLDAFEVEDCECPHCHNVNTLVAEKRGGYFHFFFIPVFPVNKSLSVKCRHCHKEFKGVLPDEIAVKVLEHENQHPTKRPFWHCCGCSLILLVLAAFAISMLYAKCSGSLEEREAEKEAAVGYKEFQADQRLQTSKPDCAVDSVSCAVKQYIDLTVTDALDKDKIKYFSRVKGDSILVLMDVDQMGKIKKSERSHFVGLVIDALQMNYGTEKENMFIGIHGRWNMVLTYSPQEHELAGDFASESNLYSFYDEPPLESIIK